MLQQAGPATLGAEIVASSERFDDAAEHAAHGGLLDPQPHRANGRIAKSVTLFVRADNVFNRTYELAADYSTGGARVFGGVRWRL